MYKNYHLIFLIYEFSILCIRSPQIVCFLPKRCQLEHYTLYYITITSRSTEALKLHCFLKKKSPSVHRYKPHEVRFWAARFFSGTKNSVSQGLAVFSKHSGNLTLIKFLIAMLSNLAETLHSSAKLKNKQVAKIWSL